MDKVSKEEFNKANAVEEKEIPEKVDEGNIDDVLKEIENPVLAQKMLAVKIKKFLDKRMDEEIQTKGSLSESTRKWVDSFNNIMDRIQKSLQGDKNISLKLTKVSHSDIAAKIRNSEKK